VTLETDEKKDKKEKDEKREKRACLFLRGLNPS
jgi:hypothetical protein